MSWCDDITTLRRIVALRAQRVDAAQRTVAERAGEVSACEFALQAREARLLEHEQAAAHVSAWFAGSLAGGAHLIESALARQEAIEEARTLDQEMKEQEAEQLDAARDAHAEAVRLLVREQARLDLADDQYQAARRGQAAAAEAREYAEYEDRTPAAPRGRSSVGGFA